MEQKCQPKTKTHPKVKKSKKIFKVEATKIYKDSRGTSSIVNCAQHDDIFEEEDSKQNDHQIVAEMTIKHQVKEQVRRLPQIEAVLDLPKCNQESSSPLPIPRFQKSPLFQSDFYDPVAQIDFDIYTTSLTKGRMYSVLLVDKSGKIIYSDKLGHELFQGSLNNFQKVHIHDLLVTNQRAGFCQRMRFINEKMRVIIIKMIIYSKNTKRRYSRQDFTNTLTDKEIYNRFLKSISCRLRPIRITFENYEKFEGFWSKDTVQNNVPIDCFMLQARLSKKLPTLTNLNLIEDPIILRYIAANKKKIVLKGKVQNHETTKFKIERSCQNQKSSSEQLERQLNEKSVDVIQKQDQNHRPKKGWDVIWQNDSENGVQQGIDVNEFF